MVGNYTDNGVHEQGTDEARTAYQADTPGQTVHSFIKEREKAFHEQKKKVRKHFSQVFQNPLKGFPYNEEITVKQLREGTWAYANTVEKLKALNKMLKTELIIKTKGDKKKAENTFGRIIGDDTVSDEWDASVDGSNNVDARSAIVKHLEDWGFTVKNFRITHYPEVLIKEETIQEAFAAALVKKALKLANSPKSKKDFMGILRDIEKLKKGLTKDPKVHKALRGVPQKGRLPGPMMKMYGPFKREMTEVDEGKYLKYSDLLLQKSRLLDKSAHNSPAVKKIDKAIAKELERLGIQEKGNLKPPKGKQKLLRLGDDLEERDFDEGVFSKIAQDIEDGVNANKIAKKYGVDLKTIKGWITDFKKDLIRKSPRYTKEDLQRVTAEYIYGLTEGEIGDVEKLMKKGMNAKQIGKKKGYSPRRIKALTSMMQLMKQLQQNETHGDGDNRKDDEDLKKRKNAFVQSEAQDPIENWLKDWGYGMKEKKGVDGRTKAFKEKLINLGYSKAEIEATMKESVEYDNPSFEEFQEKMGRMDGAMLTGQEISSYFRKNPVKDKTVRKAATIALDHGGAMTYAVKKIEKLKRGLSKHKDVKKALQFANEEVTFEEVIEGFSEPQIKKLKSAYAGLKGVDPTSPTGKKLLMMMKGRDEDELIALYKADINFISLLAASNLIARFKYDSQKIIKLRKEDQEYLASNPSLFERILADVREAPVMPSTQTHYGDESFDHSVQVGVDKYVAEINKQLHSGRFAKLHKEKKTEMKARKATKYYRVEEWEMGKAGSIHAFIDIETGDIFKPAGWKAPAKGARGNIRDQNYIKYISKYPDAYYGGHLYK